MTDKELIKQEIERRLSNLWDLIPEGEKVLQDTFTKEDANNLGKYTALESILQFIDSLPEEPASEDLEDEINRVDDWYPVELKYIQEIAHHFAEWQKQQMKEVLQTEYEKGRFDMMEELMKDAISCNVGWYDGYILDYTQEQQDEILLKLGANVGDKVKIIILKTG